ncbi:MAG: type II toxin-antitoxin system PemK/MazF family toxin [Rhodospirillaceae bacterium]|nr:MAG: type II toxin-antitoxin system PemK/MazF family toxin [Rhodospirillaceae bacterium]
MRRGEIWTVAGAGGYAGKPRPVVIVQDNRFAETGSLTVCGFTTDPTDAPIFRISIAPSDRNGLRVPCQIMIDKIITVPKPRFGSYIGELEDDDIVRLNRAIVVFLGIAG